MAAIVTAANTPAAQAAYLRFLARQAAAERAELGACDYCQGVLDASGDCQACIAETAAEVWAEGAWLRAAESTEYPCHCGRGQGGICC